MQEKDFFRLLRNVLVASVAAFFLSACLADEEETASDTDIVTDNEISGSVGDGPVVGAAMRVVSNSGEVLAELESDASANYGVTIRTKGKNYPLLIDARNGTDIVTNLPPDFVLLGAVREPGKKTVGNVNPFGTLAVELADELPGGVNKTNLLTAEDYVVGALGGSLETLAASGVMTTRIDESNVAEIVKASEEVGEIVRRVVSLHEAFGRPATGDAVIQAVASDLIDGVIDGRGGARVDARVSALTTVVAAQVLLESMQYELHVNGSNATDAMVSAIDRVANTTVQASLSDLVVTPATLETVGVGLDAIVAVVDTPAMVALAESAAGIQGGMDWMFIRTLIPDDYRTTLESALMTIAGGSDSTINTINDIARDGGTEPPAGNSPPTIAGSPGTSVVAGSAYSFSPTADDDDGDTLTFSIANRPAWASFDAATGTLSGTPDNTNAGVYANITISVSDGEDSASLAPFSIEVIEVVTNTAPTIAGNPPSNVDVGSAYSFTPVANDADGDVLTFSISNRPAWVSFSTATGTLSGTPGDADVGIHGSISITVSDGEASDSLGPFDIEVLGVVTNTPPTISGSPPASVDAGNAYSFTPTTDDADGDVLTFSIANQPAWANFSTTTGTLSGTPADTDVGDYSNITITVSDGQYSASLGPFSITVSPVTLGSVTLSWAAPTENEDGTPLTDLAGYKIYWGTTPGVYTDSVTLDNPGLTSYMVDNLVPGTYEFVATAYDAAGVESVYSNPATKVVQ